MISKEFIQNEIDSLEDLLYNAKRDNCKAVIEQCEDDLKQYNQVLKDLEALEIFKKKLKINPLSKKFGFYGAVEIRRYLKENSDIIEEILYND